MEKIKIFKLQVEKTSIGNNTPELKGMNVFGSSERTINGVDYVFIEYVPDWVSYEFNIKRVGEYIEVQTPYDEKDYIRDAFIEYHKQYEDGKTPSDEDCEKLVNELYDNVNRGRYKGILIEPVKHLLPELLNELKYGRTSEDQKFLRRCIDAYNRNDLSELGRVKSFISEGDFILCKWLDMDFMFKVKTINVIPNNPTIRPIDFVILVYFEYNYGKSGVGGTIDQFKYIKHVSETEYAEFYQYGTYSI